jgi:hypothetical protein
MPFFPTSLIQLRDITGVAAGGTATINCPKGWRYRRIILALQDSGVGNTNAPAVSAITSGDLQVILGSKVIRRLTGTQLDYLNTQNGSQYASYGVAGAGNGGGITYLPIFYEEPWRKRADFQNGLACETGWLDQNGVFQIKVPIAAGTTTPVLGALAIVDGFSSGKPNPVMKMYSDDANTASATLDLANIFQGAPASDLVESISLFDPSDSNAQSKQVIKARLILNGQVVLDDVTNAQMIDLLKGADMNPTVGAYNIVLDHDDLFESLRSVGSISASQLTVTLAAASAGTLRRVTQRLGDPTL